MTVIHDILRSLGITRNYRGYTYIVYAVELVLENENRLNAITKEVYWEVARRYGCEWSAVERNFRTIVKRAWSVNPERLIEIAGYPLAGPPTASEFIEIISNHIQRFCMAQV